ncbi:MAG: enoyl-CoA hydratase/isomerase family protein [Acidimicrobiia bacterium]
MKRYQRIRLDVDGGAATITFDIPERANALGLVALQETLHALSACEGRADVGAVVLTGAGSAFCSGFDLKEIPLEDDDAILEHFRELALWWHQVLHKITRLPKPVLAAVNGVAAGGGFGISLAADLAVCIAGARFVCAWHSIGIANDTATSYSLARVVGMRRAMELMLTNRTLDAAEALEWGLVNRVYAGGDFGANVTKIAADLAAAPTHLQAMAKDRFHMGWRQSVEECTEFEIQNVLASVTHPHFRPQLERFLSKDGRSNAVQVRLP